MGVIKEVNDNFVFLEKTVKDILGVLDRHKFMFSDLEDTREKYGQCVPELPSLKYKTIYADPPWPERGGGKIKRGADRHYNLMTVKDIISLPVQSICEENAHLYLWVTNNYLPAGLEVMKAWGFTYKTVITWGKDKFGLGQYFRGQTEHCLFGVKGNLPYKVIDGKRKQGRTLILAPRGKHSQKPQEMRKAIELVSYAPYIELFARDYTPNWDVWGDEVS